MAYSIIKLAPQAHDLSGKTFSHLVAIAPVERRWGVIMWLCICDCDTETLVSTSDLNSGNNKSCGCKKGKWSHGMSKSVEYKTWARMIQRCDNPRNVGFHNYGGRGISVCKRWVKFDNFIADMGMRPSKTHSIDRIDNEKDYSPENCRWATPSEQARNRRYNAMLLFGGEELCTAEWAERTGVSQQTIYARINRYGWSTERALTTPVKK